MRNVLTVTLCLVATFAGVLPALAQPPAPAPDEVAKKPFIGSTRFGFDPTVIQPGSHVFFADARGDNEIEVFKDGKLAVDLQLFGGDFVHYGPEGRIRVGLNVGLGITQLDEASVLLTNATAFLQIGQYYRLDIGWMYGVSAKEGLNRSQRDRSAFIVGVSFPTKLNEGLKKLLKSDD